MSDFNISRLAHAQGVERVPTGAPFPLRITVEDWDLDGGPCPVALTIWPGVCAITPALLTVDVPEGDAAGEATTAVTVTGPVGTIVTLKARPAGGGVRKLRLVLGAPDAG